MAGAQNQIYQSRPAQGVILAVAALSLVALASNWIVTSDSTDLVLGIGLAAGAVMVLASSSDWRKGIYIFFSWLVFEDLIRKYTGNTVYMFFAKDIILGVTYVAMLMALRQRRLLLFKPPFFVWISIFFWVGALEVLNPNSPNILYGLLGLKLYFYYVPLMFAGYAILRSEEDLYKALVLNMVVALVVSGLGIAQSVLGLSFLNPTDLDANLQSLGHDIRYSPITHLEVQRGTSVYVSEGRYSQALALFFIFGLGTVGYLLMRTKRGRSFVFLAFGVVVLATIMAGVRSSFVSLIISAAVLGAGFVWGGSWSQGKTGLKMMKTISSSLAVAVAAILLMIVIFPDAIYARWAIYAETLSGDRSELGYRAWEYPYNSMASVFTQPNWEMGNGIGTASLGTQYVSKALDEAPPKFGSESGFGGLILEFGLIGPVLWLLWTAALLISAWRVVRKLKNTPMFPLGFALLWYQAYILIFGFFYTLAYYQNYLTNAYLWLSVGMLFRLPELLPQQKPGGQLQRATAGE